MKICAKINAMQNINRNHTFECYSEDLRDSGRSAPECCD